MSTLVILEQRSGVWQRLSFEAIGAGLQLDQPVKVALLGTNLDALAAEAAAYSVEEVIVLDHPGLAQYTPDAFATALEQLVQAIAPQAVLFPHTYQVRDYAPKLATRFNTVLVSDVVAAAANGETIVLTRQLFGGKLNAELEPASRPIFISIQAGAFRAAQSTGKSAPIRNFAVTLSHDQIRTIPEEPFRESSRSVDLSAAHTIVAVGRGIGQRDRLHVVEELAESLGAQLAASRPICDNEWLPMERQVGSSGQTVAPKLYLAIGISGAIQHLVGMKGSRTIVAINKDEHAPIFEAADYGIVGDLFEVVPALLAEIKKAKA